MPISEKTLELNICSEISRWLKKRIIWTGLTQKQEAKAGWDACTRINGRFFILQFKSSKKVKKTPTDPRRFYAKHEQMLNLIKKVKSNRSVFYVFPDLSTRQELLNCSDILDQTYVYDVKAIPRNIPFPLKKDGAPRKSGLHYIDIFTNIPIPKIIIHSEPIVANLTKIKEISIEGEYIEKIIKFDDEINFETFWQLCKTLGRKLIGGIITNE